MENIKQLIEYLLSFDNGDAVIIDGQELKKIRSVVAVLTLRIGMPVQEYVNYASGFGDSIFEICPNCHAVLERTYQEYCSNCGQKLKWIKSEKLRKR